MNSAIVPIRPSFDLAAWEDRLGAMRQQIAEAATIHEALRLSDAAEAMLAIFKVGGALIDDQNRIARMKVDAERRAGQLLEMMPKADGGARWRSRYHDDSKTNGSAIVTYADLAAQIGVTKAVFSLAAQRTQFIAAVPDKVYAEEMQALDDKRLLISSEHFIRLGRQLKHKKHRRTLAGKVKAPCQQVRIGDFREALADLPDASVSLIFTDPPYDKTSIPLYEDLACLAGRVLIDGGSLVCYAGQYALPEVFPRMTPHIRYQWTFAIRHAGGHRRQHGWKVRVAWKPLLWFVKGRSDPRYQGGYLLDLLDSSPGEKSNHDWAQGCAEAAYLIEMLCPETGLVLDPMCGSGTSLLAAKKLGRRFLGVEIDPERAQVASALLDRTDED